MLSAEEEIKYRMHAEKKLHTVCHVVIFFQKNCPNISWAKKLI